jgi:hypothetical protein
MRVKKTSRERAGEASEPVVEAASSRAEAASGGASGSSSRR